MRTAKSIIMLLAMTMVATLCLTSCGDDDDGGLNLSHKYDVIQVNGVNYACYGWRSFITYKSTWNLSENKGVVLLPCGKLSDAQKNEYDYEYMYSIKLAGSNRLVKGSKLEDYSLSFWTSENLYVDCYYASGSATVIDKVDDKNITIRFDSFTFVGSKSSYTINGTVQLAFDED